MLPPGVASVEISLDTGVHTGDLSCYRTGSGTTGLRRGGAGGGEGSKGQLFHSHPSFLPPTHKETGTQKGTVSTQGSFWANARVSLAQESMIPNYLGPKMEITAVSLAGSKYHNKGLGCPAGAEARAVSVQGRVLALLTLHSSSCLGLSTIAACISSKSGGGAGGGCISLGCGNSSFSSFLGPSRRTPQATGPGLFGNNGGNIKQGLKTGSESQTSQTGSLEGTRQREGRQEPGATHRAKLSERKGSWEFSPCPTIGCASTSACL